jgi:heme/copper-type cytochrome/quinol oxidase subunit 2
MIVHSLIAVLIAVVVVIAVLIFFARRIKQDNNYAPTQPTVTPVQPSPTMTPIA